MNWVWQVFSSECESFPIISFTQGSIVLLPPFREPVYRRNISSIWRTVFPLSYWTTSSSWRTVWAITTNRKRHPMPTIVLLKWRSPTLKTRSSIENKKIVPKSNNSLYKMETERKQVPDLVYLEQLSGSKVLEKGRKRIYWSALPGSVWLTEDKRNLQPKSGHLFVPAS